MSSTNKTTNYELSQFIGTDKPAWLTDYNNDMSKIDTAIKNVSDAEGTTAAGLANLGDRVTAAENNITTIQAGETTQNNRLTTLEGNYDTIHHEVVTLGDRVTAVEATATSAASAASSAASAASAAQADATAAGNAASAAQADATSALNTIGAYGNAVDYDFTFDSATGELAITTHVPTP